jgi:ribonuclease BN (tRNA processing enzyme)
MSHQKRFKVFSRSNLSTCIIDQENKMVFDAGPALPFIVTPRYSIIFITHSDPDHLLGLVPYARLRAAERLDVYAPQESLMKIEQLAKDYGLENISPIQVDNGRETYVSNNVQVVGLQVAHLDKEAVAYLVRVRKKKLIPEYSRLSGDELLELARQGAQLSETIWEDDLLYTGDMSRESLYAIPKARILIIDCTYPVGMSELACKYGHLCEDDVDEISNRYGTVIKIHESLGHFDNSHQHPEVERVKLGLVEG